MIPRRYWYVFDFDAVKARNGIMGWCFGLCEGAARSNARADALRFQSDGRIRDAIAACPDSLLYLRECPVDRRSV